MIGESMYFEICSEFLLYNSHYKYLGLVTLYIHCTSFYIYDDDICFSPLSHMCCFFSFFIHIFLILYNLSIFSHLMP